MSEKDIIFRGRINQTGIFSFKDFYSFTYDWLKEENYDVFEKKYTEKVKGDSKDVEITWSAEREISDYFKFVITIDWVIIGMKSVDVQKEGKKIKMDSATLGLRFKAILVKDYEDRWENYPLWKFMRGLYEKYIIKNRVDQYQIKLLEELEEFISQCKSFLALEGRR